jgi:DNA-directed RNA polymerase specialized sigma subunit
MATISKKQLLRLQGRYKTDAAVGRMLGITRQAVYQIRKKYGIAPLKDKHGERNREIVQLYHNGLSGIEIAKRLHVSITQTYRILRRENLIKGGRRVSHTP